MVHCRIYSVEGNIGSGKSTLVKILKQHFGKKNFKFLDEPVDVWNTIKDSSGETILSKFYKDQEKYAFSFQMMAYISRIAKLRNTLKTYPNATIITERSVMTDRNVFAKMLYDDKKIEEVNYHIYLKWFDEFTKDLPIIGIIYVKANPDVCYERVLKRSREGETIPIEYLVNCDAYHNKWLDTQDVVLTLDANHDKSETILDYEQWITIIEMFFKKTTDKQFESFKEHIDICINTHGV